MTDIKNRYEFALIFDVKDGNPNGDPDAGNLPRLDPETGEGLVTDVCLKRKVRNYVQLTRQEAETFGIFIKEQDQTLNDLIDAAYGADKLNLDLNAAPKSKEDGSKRKKKGEAQGSEIKAGREQMCRDYYDIRTFGAVLSTGANAGQVRGPVQMTFARSVEPIVPLEHSITRCVVTNPKDKDKERTMGRKTTVPYGLYVGYGFVSPAFANQTGFSESDLAIFWEALQNMFEHDRSAARGLMGTCKLVVFKHDSALGNAPARKLFDSIKIKKSENCGERSARSFADYDVVIEGTEKRENGTVGLAQCPGVEVLELM